MATINLRNVAPVLMNSENIGIYGETIEDELMLQEVDRVFEPIDTCVELGLNLTDFINLFKIRNPDYDNPPDNNTNGIYFKNTEEEKNKIANAIDNKFTLWANDNVDGDNYLNALQLRMELLRGTGKYFISSNNPNKNELTNKYDGNNISLIMFKYIADCLIQTPDALSMFSSLEGNKNSLVTLNDESVGTQFMNKLFEYSTHPTDKPTSVPKEFYGNDNSNLFSVFEQLFAICPDRFEGIYTDNDFVSLPLREGDEIAIKLILKGAINGQHGASAIHKIMSRGMPSIDQPISYESPINVVFDNTKYPVKYHIRDSTYLVKFRLTESHEDRLIRNDNEILKNVEKRNNILEKFDSNKSDTISGLLRICRGNVSIYNESLEQISQIVIIQYNDLQSKIQFKNELIEQLESDNNNEELIQQYNNIIDLYSISLNKYQDVLLQENEMKQIIELNNNNIIKYKKDINDLLEKDPLSLKILFNRIYSLNKKKEKLLEYISFGYTRKEKYEKNVEIINTSNKAYEDAYEYFNSIYDLDIFLYAIETGMSKNEDFDTIQSGVIIGFETFEDTHDIELGILEIEKIYRAGKEYILNIYDNSYNGWNGMSLIITTYPDNLEKIENSFTFNSGFVANSTIFIPDDTVIIIIEIENFDNNLSYGILQEGSWEITNNNNEILIPYQKVKKNSVTFNYITQLQLINQPQSTTMDIINNLQIKKIEIQDDIKAVELIEDEINDILISKIDNIFNKEDLELFKIIYNLQGTLLEYLENKITILTNSINYNTYNLIMLDSYGNGWMSGKIELYVNNHKINSFTLDEQYIKQIEIEIPSSSDYNIQFKEIKGPYPSEIIWILQDSNEEPILYRNWQLSSFPYNEIERLIDFDDTQRIPIILGVINPEDPLYNIYANKAIDA
jgi:hypothetical protein